MKRKVILGIVSLIGLCSFAVLGSSPEFFKTVLESVQNNSISSAFSNRNAKTETNEEKSPLPATVQDEKVKEIPEHILYDQVFHLVIVFNDRAKSQEAKGEAVTLFRSYFKDEAQLNAQEDDLLTQTANNFNQEVQVIDAQAEVVIEQLRQQFPVGSTPEEQLIQPSPELLQLQEQRNKLALYYRDQLRVLLGDDKFNEFDNFVKGDFAAGFRVMPVSSILNKTNQGGKK